MNSLLPPNATAQERHLEQATSRAFNLPTPARQVLDPDTCPAALLPWLAWAVSVPEWESGWTEAQKRAVIRNAIFVHRHRGTPGAVRRALSALGYDMTLTEWFEHNPPEAPYTFRLEVELGDTGIDTRQQNEIERLVSSAKNARSHLAGLRLVGISEGDLYLGAVLTVGNTTEIDAFAGQELTAQGAFLAVAGTTFGGGFTVYPG